MPSWLSEILKLTGFTTPFVYAAAVYGFFHYVDKKASAQAKKAISAWLQPKEYDKTAVADAIVENAGMFTPAATVLVTTILPSATDESRAPQYPFVAHREAQQ
jgi:hypothetical protein